MKAVLVFLFALASTLATAQDYNPKKEMRQGDKDLEDNHYHEAIIHYKRAAAIEPNNIEANYKLGMCLINSKHHNEKPLAVKYLKKAIELRQQGKDPDDKYWDARFLLARSLQSSHEFLEAKEQYEKFHEEIKLESDPQLIAMIERYIRQCQFGHKKMQEPLRVTIENVGPVINSKFPDYAPVISADESLMIFTSRRPNTIGGGRDPNDDMFFEDVYMSRKVNGEWAPPENMGKQINGKSHDASIAVSPDGKLLFLYASNNKGSYFDILVSKWDDRKQEWSKPKGISPKVNGKNSWESSISITADNKTIYFSSDKAGGLGQKDIYTSTWDEKENEWSDPINLGPTINTSGDDEAPFIHPDGTFYFSSNGQDECMGEHDIYFTKKVNGRWEKPTNIGYPINTAEDDLFFVLSGDKNNAYYSSEMSEGSYGEKDIYVIRMPTRENLAAASTKESKSVKPIKMKIKPLNVKNVQTKEAQRNITILTGTVIDEDSKEPLESQIYLVDNVANRLVDSVTSNALTGRYTATLPAGKNYGLVIDKQDYLFHSENFDLKEAKGYNEDTLDVELKKIEIGKAIILKNIFYDYAKATLRDESQAELDRVITIMEENPRLKVEIGGHTDSDGSDAYNEDLSQRRAKSVVDYLIEKGIAEDRLIAKGYGEKKPIASNDTEEGMQLNRRTEFTILQN